MHRRLAPPLASLAAILAGLAARADEAKPVTFQDDVAAVFRSRCNTCHNADKQRGGLSLENYGTALQGGSSGKVIEPGDPDNSALYLLVSHAEEPKMPPNAPRIPDEELELIRRWIEAGAPENAGGAVAMKAKPKLDLKLDPDALGKPEGPPAMPEGLSTEPAVVAPRPNAVVAMAASPWAPLVAVAGHRQVLLYHPTRGRLLGVLPFEEGTIHVLKFSRNGSLLLAGGGRGGQSGVAVAWDVKTGKRIFEIGKEKEYDVVLAADISADHGQVALGGPGKVVRVYSTADGELQHEIRKHTEWITALEFSPDGVLLATGDRNNGLFLWESQTGREFAEMRGHGGAITDIAWRPDSNAVASASEDTTIRLWEVENGNQLKSWGAHAPGVASVRFAMDGRLVSTGRDRVVRVWGADGAKQREFEPFGDLGLKAAFSHDGAAVVAGDWSGEVRVWDAGDGRRLGNLAANPGPVRARLDEARAALPAATSAAEAARVELAALEEAAKAGDQAHAQAAAALAEAEQVAAQAQTEATNREQALAAKAEAEAAANAALAAAQAASEMASAVAVAAEQAVPARAAAEASAREALASTRSGAAATLERKGEVDRALAEAAAAVQAAETPEDAERAAAALGRLALEAVERAVAVAASGQAQSEAHAALAAASASAASAPAELEAARAKAAEAAAAVEPARAAVAASAAAKAGAEADLAAARIAAEQAVARVAPLKAEAEAKAADKAARDKALADRRPALGDALARLEALKEDVEALAAELARGEPDRTALAGDES